MLQLLIYIPVWIDQKLDASNLAIQLDTDLHSSMDRLETLQLQDLLYLIVIIYIPVWIDQKRILSDVLYKGFIDLHSSMDRLETYIILYLEKLKKNIYIPVWIDQKPKLLLINSIISKSFTFQYGQIRNMVDIKQTF